MKPTLAALLTLAVLGSAHTAYAGAWTQAEGKAYVKAWTRSLRGSNGYFKDRKARDLGITYQDLSLNLYGELGLTDTWTLVGNVQPIGYAAIEDENALFSGPWRVGARRGLLFGDLKLAVEAHAGYAPPFGDKIIASGIAEAQTWDYQPTVSGAQADAELQLGYGLPWGWIAANAGARWYSAQSVDPVIYGNLQLGVQLGAGFVFDTLLFLHEPLGEVTRSSIAGTGQTRYLGIGLGLSYWLTPNWGLNLGASGVAYAYSNAAAAPLTFGVEYKN